MNAAAWLEVAYGFGMRGKRMRGARAASGMPVAFEHADGRRYRALFVREDGVRVAFEGGSFNSIGGEVGQLPHDMAHLVVESELGLLDGVWGTLAAGGLFERATRIVGGRQKPHAAQRGRELVAAARDCIIQAEIVVRVVCEASKGPAPQGADSVRRSLKFRVDVPGLTDDALTRAYARLRDAAASWKASMPGEQVRLTWATTSAGGGSRQS